MNQPTISHQYQSVLIQLPDCSLKFQISFILNSSESCKLYVAQTLLQMLLMIREKLNAKEGELKQMAV